MHLSINCVALFSAISDIEPEYLYIQVPQLGLKKCMYEGVLWIILFLGHRDLIGIFMYHEWISEVHLHSFL